MFKNKNLWFMLFMLFALVCFVAIGTCLIVDVAVTGTMTWSGLTVASILFVWCVALPFFFSKRQVAWSLSIFTVLVLPFLWYLGEETVSVSWFMKLGLPLGIMSVGLAWLMYALFRFVKIHMLYRAAVTVLLVTVVANPIIHHLVGEFTGEKAALLISIINIFSGVVAAAVLGIVGYCKTRGKQN